MSETSRGLHAYTLGMRSLDHQPREDLDMLGDPIRLSSMRKYLAVVRRQDKQKAIASVRKCHLISYVLHGVFSFYQCLGASVPILKCSSDVLLYSAPQPIHSLRVCPYRLMSIRLNVSSGMAGIFSPGCAARTPGGSPGIRVLYPTTSVAKVQSSSRRPAL